MSDGSETADRETPEILHCFADRGMESEALAVYGSVTQVGINPVSNEFSKTVTADASEPGSLPFKEGQFDLALLHPPCTKWSRMTSIDGDADEHENLIPQAREIGRRYADHYIIENRPEAPLRDPTVLNGKQFGLPIHYERAFETSFRVDSPPRHQTLNTECSTYFSADRSRDWWASTKGYTASCPKEHLVKNCLPAPYIHCLARSWCRVRHARDAQVADDNNGRPPRDFEQNQLTLAGVGQRDD